MKIQPLADRIMVKVLEAKDVTKGGIILPDSAQEKPQEAKVVAIGKGKVSDEGKTIPPEVKVGDKILMLCHRHYDIWETNPEGLARKIKEGYNPQVAVLSKSARLSWD